VGYASRERKQSTQAAVERCVLTLQRDGRIRIDGNQRVLELAITSIHEQLKAQAREAAAKTEPAEVSNVQA
jgi:hypothetical protein